MTADRDISANLDIYIRDELDDLGWVTKNPSRVPTGQVWTAAQYRAEPRIADRLNGHRPRSIVKVGDNDLWVISADQDRKLIEQTLDDAEKHVARRLSADSQLTVPIISGVAGNESTGYEVRTRLLVKDRYKPVVINGREATGLLDPAPISMLIESRNPRIKDLVVNENLFLRKAERINRHLHAGGINKNDRAKTMAALLLALSEDEPLEVGSVTSLVREINARAATVLRRHGKSNFDQLVKIRPPTSTENLDGFRSAIVHTLQQLMNINIRSAMNSGTDVLGKFYEVFLRYGNGAKEIGIVLTPRHLTRFAVETLGVEPNDIVLDPACGTGGFLVAAFDHVRNKASAKTIERFRKLNLFGIERESAVAALAVVNMIFRGDGSTNIVEGNCFLRYLHKAFLGQHATASYEDRPPEHGDAPVTRVFMNPPFALKENDEREYNFIDTTLESMADNGLMFAIVPISVMSETGAVAKWRREVLLANNTLVSVVTFPLEVFYPVKNVTVGIVIRKGQPHQKNQNVLWAKMADDGFRKSKAKRLPIPGSDGRDLDKIQPVLRAFVSNQSMNVTSVPTLLRACPIDLDDPITELVPEAYIESQVPDSDTLSRMLDDQIRHNISGLVVTDLQFRVGSDASIINATSVRSNRATLPLERMPAFQEFAIGSLFDLRPGDFHGADELDPGPVPLVSCSVLDNGISGLFDIPETNIHRNALTIAFNGTPLTTHIHPYLFGAKDDVAVAIPKMPMTPEVLVFIQAALNAERWRFSYYRKCFKARMDRLTVRLPVTSDGGLNTDFMALAVRAQPYWWFLEPRLAQWHKRPSDVTTAENAADELIESHDGLGDAASKVIVDMLKKLSFVDGVFARKNPGGVVNIYVSVLDFSATIYDAISSSEDKILSQGIDANIQVVAHQGRGPSASAPPLAKQLFVRKRT